MNSLPDINVANDVGAVRGLRTLARDDQEKALRAVAKQFEAMFLQQMLKVSRETRWDDGFAEGEPGAGAMDSYREWRDDQMAQTLSAKGSLGLADMLVKQLMPRTTAGEQPSASVPAAVTKSPVAGLLAAAPRSPVWQSAPQSSPYLPAHASEEVPQPSTADVLMLHNLLKGRVKE